jgi:signal-transduction protein with cAMP-binding, CBS, and nucleotidyltransferase domain
MQFIKNLKVESVSRLHPTAAWEMSPEQTTAEAVALMREQSVGCVLISSAGQIVGIFTERDLLRKVLAPGRSLQTPLLEVMTPNPVTVHPKDSIGTAMRRMIEGGYRHLPVVQDGRPTGILSVKRIVHYLAEHYPSTVYTAPPAPSFAAQPQREGA